jgi:alpha-beta hydrolase superfamily lysophospholipase
MREEELQIASDGLILKGLLVAPRTDSWPLVVLCHGFLSHKQGSKYRRLAQVFAVANIATIRFDFRGCGESEGILAQSTVSGRWHDLKQVLGVVRGLAGFDGRLGLFGSSLGGYLALLEASGNASVRCLVVWSTPSHLAGLAKRLREAAPVPLPVSLRKDLTRHRLLPRLGRVRRVLIVHGERDWLVPVENALQIFAAVQEPKSLQLLSDADHRFSENQDREKAIGLSLAWFQRYL